MTEKEKIVIFDWGGVIESHTPGQYNQESAVNDLIMELNPNCVSDNIFRDYLSMEVQIIPLKQISLSM